jgi:hypothetical protein
MAARAKKICRVLGIAFLAVIVSATLLSYLFYRDLRKTLVGRLSDKASAVIGQRVDIGDISFSLSHVVHLDDLQVRNPEGFAPGNLLSAKRISLDVDLRAFSKGDIHFRRIVVYSPVLSIVKDSRGQSNISEGLRRFLSKKSTTLYRIDEMTFISGGLDFSGDPRLRNEGINLSLKNLSSRPNTEASIEGTAFWAGVNKIRIGGRVFPGDNPKKFALSLSGDDITFSPFEESFSAYHIDAEKVRGNIRLDAAGDTEKGGAISFALQLKSPGVRFYREKALDIGLAGDLSYHIVSDSAEIRRFTIKAGKGQVLSMKGGIRDLTERPVYDFTAKIGNMDLSAFQIVKGIAITGTVASEALRVRGRGIESLPEVEGTVFIRNGSVGSQDLVAGNIDGRMKFSSGREMSAEMVVSASLTNVAGRRLIKAADARLSLSAHGQRRNVTLSAGLTALPFVIETSGDGNVALGDLRILLGGTLREKNFSGKSSFRLAKIKYKDYLLRSLTGSAGLGYAGRMLTIGSPDIKTDILSLGAESVGVRPVGPNEGFLLEAKGLNATYPSEKAALKGLAVSGRLQTAGRISGDFDFSLKEATFRGAAANGISGKASFSDKKFSFDVPRAGIAGGRMRIFAEGLTSGGPFPAKGEMIAEHVDIGQLVRPFMKDKPSYLISGDAEKAVFSGAIDSAESLHGKLTTDLRKVSVLDERTKRNLFKDASLRSEIAFRGKDCTFSADAAVGKTTATFSGEARQFLGDSRSVHLRADLAETPVTEIRNSFWDAFPDSLLYAGVEGSLSSDLAVDYGKGGAVIQGDLRLKEFTLTGENGEYSVGPVNGVVPISYGRTGGDATSLEMTPFERSGFDRLKKRYAGEFRGEGYRRITVGSFRYGFRLLDNITLWMKPEKGVLEIGRFSANIFGGRLNGSAEVDLTGGFHYRAGGVLEGMSLTRLCDDIEPIKGYISGKVDGVGMVKGSESGIQGLIGKADFWTYSTKEETTKISREFLRKMGGPSLKSYIGDRRFDKGEMSLYLQKGFVIFRGLEISHRNFFGMQDLSVKVAPLSNKISLEDLMWSIVEAASRAGKRAQ